MAQFSKRVTLEEFTHQKDSTLFIHRPFDGNLKNNFHGASAAVTMPEGHLPMLPSKNKGKHQESEEAPSLGNAVTSTQIPKSNEDGLYSTSTSTLCPAYVDPVTNVIDLSCLEPPPLPNRVYYSERIPREQVELLNRSSKSDDTHDCQFLTSHLSSDINQQDSVMDSRDKLHNNGTLSNLSQQVTSTTKPLSTDGHSINDGLAQLDKYKELPAENSQMNPKLSQHLGSELKQISQKKADSKDTRDEAWILKSDTETNDHNNLRVDETTYAASQLPASYQVSSVKHNDDPALDLPEINWGEATANVPSNDTTVQEQPFSWTANSVVDVLQDCPANGVSKPVQGDIIVDIEDRIPRDFLADVFSKAILSEDSSGISPLSKDGAGLSLNMENHEPKHWSYFQKLAQEGFDEKDALFIDQDRLGFSSAVRTAEEDNRSDHLTPTMTNDVLGHVEPYLVNKKNLKEVPGILGETTGLNSNYGQSLVKDTDSVQFDAMMETLRMQESQYEDGRYATRSTGLPPLDPSLGEFDISTLQVIRNDDLEELKELGSGTFGTVYHGKWRGTDVAIKRIKKSCFTGRSSEQERLTIEFWREADILSKLHHPNVVAFYGVVQDGPGGTLATVAEYMVDGSLRHVLLRKDRYLDRRKRLIIAMDAAFGMEYLHSKNIVHFDLKCDNLLVNLKDPLRPICKVGDFGLSKIKRNTLVSGGVRGTLPWMAPELLNGSSNKVSEKVDVFSFGIVLWEILTGEEPYANMHYGAIIGGIVNNTLRPTIPSSCDPEWRTLMEQCWEPNPAVRPNFTQIASRLRVMSAAASQNKVQGQKASK
ncbi:Kinase family protein [Quillaja saponaria]|uniref:Kinase family protein n=1 Tax=Quillaja saponaria TaxID=32244 RepID=A0AAD7PBC5_QUISA|nr:Kinase family protein [Quillaja saponaria]